MVVCATGIEVKILLSAKRVGVHRIFQITMSNDFNGF
jgi:hypothetical protein